MYKRLLVAIDGSAASQAALSQAIELAAKDGSDVRLVHVIDETIVPWDDKGPGQRERALGTLAGDSARILNDAQSALRRAGRSASSAQLVRNRWRDTASDLIAAEASRWGADLIVIGSRGYGPIRRALAGSVDAAVMRIAPMSVLPVTSSTPTRPQARPVTGRPPAAPHRVGLA